MVSPIVRLDTGNKEVAFGAQSMVNGVTGEVEFAEPEAAALL
jgi:hypothetical protein